MNRRGFIKGFLAACVAPAVFLPVAQDRYRWVVDQKRLAMAVINPAWESAEYGMDLTLYHGNYSGRWRFVMDHTVVIPDGWDVEVVK